MTRTIHMGLSVRGALRNGTYKPGNGSLVGCFRDSDTGKLMNGEEIFEELCDHLEAGHRVIPMGDCNNWCWKDGCKGHWFDSYGSKHFQRNRHDPSWQFKNKTQAKEVAE
jgi:hypothetical protein